MNLLNIVIAVLVIAALFILEAWSGRRWPKHSYRYRIKGCVMTQAEKAFFVALVDSIGNKYYVFPQVHLPSILDHKVVGQNWRGAFRHIDEKSVDFVLCDKLSLSPVLAIELDDRSHERPDRQKRDREVEGIMKEAHMPLLRVKDTAELVQKIELSLNIRPQVIESL